MYTYIYILYEPVILDIEILGVDGGIDGIVEALSGRQQLAVILLGLLLLLLLGRSRCRVGSAAVVRLDDGLVDVAARVRPRRRRRGRRATPAHQRAAVVLPVQAQHVSAACNASTQIYI